MDRIVKILSGKKGAIVEKCFDLTLKTYPPETSRLLKREEDRFLNPVGFAIRSGIESIFDELVGAMDPDRLLRCVENVVKVRAVQAFTPSEAISFVYLLKRSIREEIGARSPRDDGRGLSPQREHGGTTDEKEQMLVEIDERIDRIALLAFDVYMQCREKIHELRLKEAKALHGRR